MINLKEYQQVIERVIQFSQSYPFDLNCEDIINKWYENKKWFIEANNGELIFEYPEIIKFEFDEEEKMRRATNFIGYVANFNDKLADFLFYNRFNFFENITKEEYRYNDKIVPKGMKITRALKFFEGDQKLLDTFQTKMSMILQENCVSGRLCISVHPLDFLSSSENTYNWRSCHALDGEYRAGNLSYMCDSGTVICYLKGEKDAVLPHFPPQVPWNNKKWRMLLFFSTNRGALFAGRQYPFFSQQALDWVKQLVCDRRFVASPMPHTWSDWTNQTLTNFKLSDTWSDYTNRPYYFINGELYRQNKLIIDCPDPLHYNDLINSTCYRPWYCWTTRTWNLVPREPVFNIGESVPCLRCGIENINISGSMLCDEHELQYGTYEDDDMFCECDHCGERLFVDDYDTIRLRDGEFLCRFCAENLCMQCDHCGEWVWREQIRYDSKRDAYYCDECYDGD